MNFEVLSENLHFLDYYFGLSSPAIPCNTKYLQLPQFAKSVPANNQIAVGNTLVLECQTGYSLTGGGNAECQVRPVLSQKSRCEVVNCGQPPVPANSNFTGENFTFSQHVNYTCLSAYEQTSGGTSLQCAANGRWMGEQIVCAGEVHLFVSRTVRAWEKYNLQSVQKTLRMDR